MRLYIAGDSLIGGPARSSRTTQQRGRNVKLVGPGLDYRVSTGLAQPRRLQLVRLPAEQGARAQAERRRHELRRQRRAVAVRRPAAAQQYGTPEWIVEYARRVAGLMDEVLARKARIVWVGLPIPRDPSLAAKFR